VSFRSDRAGDFDIWTKRADGSAQAVLELDGTPSLGTAVWGSRGEWLIYKTASNTPGAGDILAVRPDRDDEPVELITTEFTEKGISLSPDGRWLAYASNESGTDEVYVVPFPNAGEARWAISTGGGNEPRWAHSGRELFYRNGSLEMVAVEVDTDPVFSVTRSTVLFPASDFHRGTQLAQYDVTSDDQRFLMITRADQGADGDLILVVNWFEELKRLSPN
jgi:Tol biopolymer transport system component